ncbi:unnamed protein product [Prorocentrum cordatum]|uniref:Uncharacterized protein n=1 Tax=Prorocentrum cordatum TaxID=2364126 RepID=A0ABN9TEZ3_9DINO|nr:unnamed protein product [Polarella glacialis]
MELRLRGTTVPDGHTRRQAPVARLRRTPVRLPTDPERIAEPVLVEVMKVVASAQLVLQKGQANYSLHAKSTEAEGEDAGGGFDISLQLQGLLGALGDGGSGDAAAAQGGEPGASAADLAKVYLEETGVVRYFQAMVQAMVHDRPRDPYLYMLEQLQSRAELWVYSPENGLPIAIRRTPTIGDDELVDAASYQMTPGEQFRAIETREGADGVLFLRLADGRGWLFDRKPGVGRMCERAREEVPAGAAPTQARPPSKASVEGRRRLGSPRSRAEVRRRLKQGLRQACLGGEFQRAFEEVMGAEPAGAGAPREAAPGRAASAEHGPGQEMGAALEEAFGSGQPQTVLAGGSGRSAAEPGEARAAAARGGSQATAGGAVGTAPQDARAGVARRPSRITAEGGPPAVPVHHGQSDAVRLRARGMLEERCSDGTLDALFMEAMGTGGRPQEACRVPLPAEPPKMELLSQALPCADPAGVQRELQAMKGDSHALYEQLSLLNQHTEKLKLDHTALHDRLDDVKVLE